MNKYGDAAVMAVDLCLRRKISPAEAWEAATSDLFGPGTSSQEKGCPRDAFLGLCDAGLVAGIAKGNYTRSRKNTGYALRAVALLKENPALVTDIAALWRGVLIDGEEKQHNSQMDVVLSLWNRRLIA